MVKNILLNVFNLVSFLKVKILTMHKRLYIILFCILFINTFSFAISLDSTNLPLFVIDTKGKTIADEPKTDANLKIIYNREGLCNKPSDSGNIYEGNIGIELRGSYSRTLPQKPYGFETRTITGLQNDINLFQMPAEHDWILTANYNDKSFMRNTLAFYLFNEMGQYASRTKFCEVIVNNEYQGIYILCEKLKRDKKRINISKLDPDDNSGDSLTGGYIFKIDNPGGEKSFISNHHPSSHPDATVTFLIDYPNVTDITTYQYNYLKSFVKSFEDALFGSNFKDLNKGYRNYINVNSFIDYFIIGEISRNVDAYKKSCFYFKNRNSKGGLLNAGPVWDFDWAWKNFSDCSDTYSNTKGEGWAYQVVTECTPSPMPPGWVVRLMEDKSFVNQLYTRYSNLRKTILSEDYIFAYIDSVSKLLNAAQERHYKKWPILGMVVGTPEVDKQPSTYSGEVVKFKNWIKTRLVWLDNNMPGEFVNEIKTTPNIENHTITRVFPNPAKDFVYFDATKLINQVIIYTVEGKPIRIINCKGKYNENCIVSNLPKGVYIVCLSFTDAGMEFTRFIKE